eukprot:143191-Hanusia_phi.AAC.4
MRISRFRVLLSFDYSSLPCDLRSRLCSAGHVDMRGMRHPGRIFNSGCEQMRLGRLRALPSNDPEEVSKDPAALQVRSMARLSIPMLRLRSERRWSNGRSTGSRNAV